MNWESGRMELHVTENSNDAFKMAIGNSGVVVCLILGILWFSVVIIGPQDSETERPRSVVIVSYQCFSCRDKQMSFLYAAILDLPYKIMFDPGRSLRYDRRHFIFRDPSTHF